MNHQLTNNCTAFPEYWYTWKAELVYIGNMCKAHDNEPDEGEEFNGCSNSDFYKDTWNANLVGAVIIATVASLACWIKFPKKQIKRV